MGSELKYGQSVIDQVAEPVNALESQIAELEVEEEKLQARLLKDKNKFDVETIRKNRDTKAELSMIEGAIRQARKHMTELIDESGTTNYNLAKGVISEVKKSERDSMQKENELIAQKVAEIHNLYFEIKEADEQIQADLKAFVDSIKPYMSQQERPEYNMYGTAGGMLGNLAMGSGMTKSRLQFIDLVPETNWGIEGLLPPMDELRKRS